MKKAALASLADISLSTMERIERGESVSNESLERVSLALGFERGYLTRPRATLSQEEAIKKFAPTKLEPVKVSSIRTQQRIRELSECDICIPHAAVPQNQFKDAIENLTEWIDLVAFVRSDLILRPKRDKAPLRKLYADILKYVRGLEKSGMVILAGTTDAPMENFPECKAAILSFSLKATDPGGIKRTLLIVDKSGFPTKFSMEGIWDGADA
jgi:hypothetical protein